MTVTEADTRLRQLEADIARLQKGLLHAQRLTTLGTLAAVVAHEFNNILTPVISYAQLALNRRDDHDLAIKALEKTLVCAERASRISESLLGFSRDRPGQDQAHLPVVIDDAIACLARDPERDGISLTIDVPDTSVAMPTEQLQQVLVNLALNATKAMRRRGGCLTIAARVERGRVRIDVADTGPGIPEPIRGRIFEPFVTSPTEGAPDQAEPGTGLGLSVCRDLVAGVGGSIDFTTSPRQGTTFHLDLPLATAGKAAA